MLSAQTLTEIRRVVQDMIDDGCCNSQGGASCGVTCEELSIRFGWPMTYGAIRDGDGVLIDADHAWLIAPTGDIVDPTIGQFASVIGEWPGYQDIAVIPPCHTMHQQYGAVLSLAERWNAVPASGAHCGTIKAVSEAEVIQHIGQGRHVMWRRQSLFGEPVEVGQLTDIGADGKAQAVDCQSNELKR